MAVNRPRWVPGIGQQKPLPEKATENCPPRVYLSHSSVRLLSQAFNGRGRPTDQRLVYGKSTRMLGSFLPFHSPESGKWKKNFSLYTICVEFPFSTPCWVKHFVLNFSFYIHLVESRTVQIVFSLSWILFKTHWLNVSWTLLKLYKVFLFIFSSLVFSHGR